MSEKKKILFGAGRNGREALAYFGADNIECFADTFKSGSAFCGKQVVSITELKKNHRQYDVVLTVGLVLTGEIGKQLEALGIPYIHFGNIVKTTDFVSNPVIAKWKDVHKGKRCFLIGNGPSLSAADLDKIYRTRNISFGCNRIDNIFDQTDWRPDYYCVSDMDSVILPNIDRIVQFPAKAIFVACTEIDNDISLRLNSIDSGKIFPLKSSVSFDNSVEQQYVGFSNDISRCVYKAGTVMYVMLQLAVYMGFREIILIGVDNTLGSDLVNKPLVHFYDSTEENLAYKQTIYADGATEISAKYATLSYASAARYAQDNGIKIINATHGGALEVFERVDFDDLFCSDIS